MVRGISMCRTVAQLAFCALILAAITVFSGCEQPRPQKAIRNPKVLVNQPITQMVMNYQDFTGRLEAVNSVEIRSRVSGYLAEAPFKEGDLVKEGDILFQIDERPYKADLNQAEANLKVAVSELRLQAKNFERAQQLVLSKAVSREDFETIAAANEKAQASVGAMEASRDRAKLYLDYARVVAPSSGRISRRFVDAGNLILADNTILTTIVSENPINAYFDIDERTYLDLMQSTGMYSGKEKGPLPILMSLANESDFTRVGAVDFIDNRVSATTGTLRIRAIFDNPSLALKPGLFIRIRLPIGAPYKAILIPDEAIQSDQERKYVWVVNEKNEAEYRSVTLGQAIRDWRVIRPADQGKELKEGLTEKDRVIVSGIQRVRKGVVVETETHAMVPPPETPLVQLLKSKDSNAN